VKFVSAEEIHAILDYHGLVEALRVAHLGAVPEAAHMVRDEPGRGVNKFVTLVGWQKDDIIAVKLVGVFPDNLGKVPPEPSVQGLVAVFDANSGAPRLVADGAAMTFRKTAADSALGATFLARQDAAALLVVGAGGLASHVIAAHTSVRPSIRRVTIWNRTPARAKALAERTKLAGVEVAATQDLERAIPDADVISCVTMSTEPLVKGALMKPGAHLDLIGAYLPTMREADDEAVVRATKFVDTFDGMKGTGDLSQPVDAGIIRWRDVRGDLFALCSGRVEGRRSAEEITLFKNVGGGHLDLFTARHLASLV
jgi:ornithine cyclodeaminase